MSDILALQPSPMPTEATSQSGVGKFSLKALFLAALEGMVAAQSRKIDEVSPLTYRYPPI